MAPITPPPASRPPLVSSRHLKGTEFLSHPTMYSVAVAQAENGDFDRAQRTLHGVGVCFSTSGCLSTARGHMEAVRKGIRSSRS